MIRQVETVIIGAGTAGLYALSQVRKKTDDFLLVNYGSYGTTCARIGCMPSKALIHAANSYHEMKKLFARGLVIGELPKLDIDRVFSDVRSIRDGLVSGIVKRMERLKSLGKRKDGFAKFLDKDTIQVEGEKISAREFILATGSSPVIPPAWKNFGGKVITTDDIFELPHLPEKIAVIGLGAIGLELGQALSRLGLEVIGIEMTGMVSAIGDEEINRLVKEQISSEFRIATNTRAELMDGPGDSITVKFGDEQVVVDKVLASLGRRPNLQGMEIGRVGAELDDRGIPVFDEESMKIKGTNIHIAGDVTGIDMIMHYAAIEGITAGYHSVNRAIPRRNRYPSLKITFSDPNIVHVGQTDYPDPGPVVFGVENFDSNGRAKVMDKAYGRIKVFADRESGVVTGAIIAAPGGEHLGHLLALAIQNRIKAVDLRDMPYYHPTLEEGLSDALDDLLRKLDT